MAEMVARLASERAVVVFTKSGCCMCTAVTTLLGELAVSAAVHELDRDPLGKEMERELARRLYGSGGRGGPPPDPLGKEMERELARRLYGSGGRGGPAVPAVFIGGSLVGGTSKVMAMHLKGELVPMLKSAGALWL
uniref:Glutaredoxin domain-containing protein n=1 Tax=Oryza glumipatula TaxID=40148 RepID=A0A0E0BLT6_9ORYZ